MVLLSAVLGFPESLGVGRERELKKATEAYFACRLTESQLLAAAAELRAAHWRLQQAAGVDLILSIRSNDFALW